MRLHRKVLAGLAVGMAAVMVSRAQSIVPNERGLWQLWAASTNAAGEHASVVTACGDFRTQTPQDPFVVVVTGLEAWQLLKMGSTQKAISLFESMLTVPENATYLQIAGAEMARVWLTRIDRDQVQAGLKKIYVRDIAFPVTLESLKSLRVAPIPPLNDRWGKPWSYRLESSIKGMDSQHYVLESTRLGARTDLATALAQPYAGQIKLEPARLLPVSTDTVEFTTRDGTHAFLQAGGKSDGVTVAYLGVNLIVMADESHWRISPKPR
jgi:hypothetical protein